MAIFGDAKKKHHHHHSKSQGHHHHHSPPKYQQEQQSTAIPIPFSSPPPPPLPHPLPPPPSLQQQQQQSSYFPPQFPPTTTTSFTYEQPTSPSSWALAPPPYQPYQVTVSQTYLIPPQSSLQMPSTNTACPHIARLKAGAITVTNLLQGDVPECVPGARIFNDAHYLPVWQQQETFNEKAPLYNLIASKLDNVVTLIDGDRWSGDEKELAIIDSPKVQEERSFIPSGKGKSHDKGKGGTGCPIASAITSINYFDKVNLYANSKLPLDLPPMKLYISTFPLLCLAAEYAERAYVKPRTAEKETHVEADCRMGTKAMLIKSIPLDDMATIVFAIRGSQTFMDWAVNLKTAPSSPINLLDDSGNLCHSGFLSVARKMIKPVAARLRHLLYEGVNGQQRSTKNYSLLITGHSAGGAIASLLYSHMLSAAPETSSELRDLTSCFKRIHCISFGAPPVSLLPLMKPPGEKLKKSLFLSFLNEGDPVGRADKKYVTSLLDLYSKPAPSQTHVKSSIRHKVKPSPGTRSTTDINIINNNINMALSTKGGATSRPLPPTKSSSSPPALPARPAPLPIWPVPESELSNAGRIVLLRSIGQPEAQVSRKQQVKDRMDDGVIAQTITDEQLRGVVWGDPVCHMMRLYARRIEVLATNAVMGRG